MLILLFFMTAWASPKDPCVLNLLPSSTIVRVGVGSFQDPPHASGFFNLIAQQIARSTKRTVYAQTHYEYIEFNILADPIHRHDARGEFMEALAQPKLTTSKKLVQQSFLSDRHNADKQILSLMRETADPTHPISRVTEGSQETLKKLNKDYMHEQFKQYFTTGNIKWVRPRFFYPNPVRRTRLSYPRLAVPEHAQFIEWQSEKNVFAVAVQLDPNEDPKLELIQNQLSNNFDRPLKDQLQIANSKVWLDSSSTHQFLIFQYEQMEGGDWQTLWAATQAILHSVQLSYKPGQIKVLIGKPDLQDANLRSNYFSLHYRTSPNQLPKQVIYFDHYKPRPNPLSVAKQPEPESAVNYHAASGKYHIDVTPTRNKKSTITIIYNFDLRDTRSDYELMAISEPYHEELFRHLTQWTNGQFEVSVDQGRFIVVYEGTRESLQAAIKLIAETLYSKDLSDVDFERISDEIRIDVDHMHLKKWFHDRLQEGRVEVKIDGNFSSVDVMALSVQIQTSL